MNKIQKYANNITKFEEVTLNIPINDIETALIDLENKIKQLNAETQFFEIPDVPVNDLVDIENVVTFDGTKYYFSNIEEFPMGILIEKHGVTNSFFGTIRTSGLVTLNTSNILEPSETIQVGVPYFLSPNTPGKITANRPSAAIYIGMFVTQNTFMLHIQNMTTDHIHRRVQLDPAKWGAGILYPITELPQVPIPFTSLVLVIDDRYVPSYGVIYDFDLTGIRILDVIEAEANLGIAPGTLLPYLQSKRSYIYYTDPRSKNTVAVTTLQAGTPNLILSNTVPGEENSRGNLLIKNIPTVSAEGTGHVKEIVPDALTGNLLLKKTQVVEKLLAGSNITLNPGTGVGAVTISSNVSKSLEIDFNDVQLQGTYSRIVQNSILPYIEFFSTKTNSTTYTISIPANVDTSTKIEIYMVLFGTITIVAPVTLALSLKYKFFSNTGNVTGDGVLKQISLPIQQANLSIRTKILEESPIAGSQLVVQLIRNIDTVYPFSIGVRTLTCKYSVI